MRKILSLRHSLGLTVILVGQPIIWVLRDWIGTSHSQAYSILFLILGIALLIRPGTLASGKLFGNPMTLLSPAFFLLPSISLALYAAHPEDNNVVYMLFVLVVLFAMHTVPYEKFLNLPMTVLLVSGAACVLSLYLPIAGGLILIGQRFSSGDSNSPIQLSLVAGAALLSALFVYSAEKKITRMLSAWIFVSVLSAVVVLVLTQTRSTVLGLGFCASLYLLKHLTRHFRDGLDIKTLRRTLYTGFKVVAVISFIVVAFSFTEAFQVVTLYFSKFLDYYQKGILSYVYGISTGEESAEARVVLLREAFSDMNLIGNGYQTKEIYLHFPIIQAFYDLGVVGGLTFMGVAVLTPVLVTMKIFLSGRASALVFFCSYYYMLFFPNLFLHGHPYAYVIWLPIVLFYGVTLRRIFAVSIMSRSGWDSRSSLECTPKP